MDAARAQEDAAARVKELAVPHVVAPVPVLVNTLANQPAKELVVITLVKA